MAAIFDAQPARLSFRLNLGADPVSGKTISKTIGISGIAAGMTADDLKSVTDALSPLVLHPTTAVEVSRTAILGDDGN